MEHSRSFAQPEAPEAGVVASGVYRDGRRVADIAIEEARRDWAAQGGPRRLDRPARAEPRAAPAGQARVPPARPRHRGRRARPPAPQARAVRRRAVHRRPHRAADRPAASPSARPISSSARATSSASATAPRPPTPRCASTGRAARRALAKGEDFILYAILDFIVDNYMPVLEAIEEEVEAIEDSVLVKPMTAADIERLYMLRRDLLRLRNAAGAAGRGLPPADRRRPAADPPGDAPALPRRHRPHPHACRRRSTPCARCWPSPSRRAC